VAMVPSDIVDPSLPRVNVPVLASANWVERLWKALILKSKRRSVAVASRVTMQLSVQLKHIGGAISVYMDHGWVLLGAWLKPGFAIKLHVEVSMEMVLDGFSLCHSREIDAFSGHFSHP